MMRSIAMAAFVAFALALAGCATPTPYQPLAANNAVFGGFTDQRLDDVHFRVTFQGNSVTSRDQVETYLLYRAAELTVSEGFDWFEMVDRNTHRQSQSWVTPTGPYWGWSPYWRVHGAWGWGAWDPFWGSPWSYDVQTIDRYQAIAEIAVGRGPRPQGDRGSLDARAVLQNLGPHITRPSPR